ncbi:MAG: hypothetical protein Q8N54_02855 [Sulfurimicrobium sp.]|nr:hypothetical protein [Sulfurimicrobium sp.]MDP2198123.1 hypothetical protein [Sulfurimicrobium sp.]MDP2961670.1 hypothetical protein [Sulfurimicrobium sp.]MDP3688322.1 hypothetical protein [Sulfurimicrobium sp.]MDZ7654860.1 hypothetical protein [Sulfurimicrobium sp.]
MSKKSPALAAFVIAPLMALFLLTACESKPKTEAERTVEFLRDLTDEKVAREFHPAYWEGQCKENTQIWKNGLKICRDGGPHHWMCDVITTMQDCQARSVGVH